LMRVFSTVQTVLEHFWSEQMELLHVCSFVQPIVFVPSEVRKVRGSDKQFCTPLSFTHLLL
jgi:hypothetical protein